MIANFKCTGLVVRREPLFAAKQIKLCHNPLEKMEALARGQIAFLTENPNYLSLFMVAFSPQMATVHKKIMEPLFEKRRQLSEYLHEIVEEGKAGGFIRGDINTRDVVLSYMGMVNQAMQTVFFARMGKKLSSAPPASAPETARTIMKVLTQGIAAKPEGGHGK